MIMRKGIRKTDQNNIINQLIYLLEN